MLYNLCLFSSGGNIPPPFPPFPFFPHIPPLSLSFFPPSPKDKSVASNTDSIYRGEIFTPVCMSYRMHCAVHTVYEHCTVFMGGGRSLLQYVRVIVCTVQYIYYVQYTVHWIAYTVHSVQYL